MNAGFFALARLKSTPGLAVLIAAPAADGFGPFTLFGGCPRGPRAVRWMVQASSGDRSQVPPVTAGEVTMTRTSR